jgi:hypothetical protein
MKIIISILVLFSLIVSCGKPDPHVDPSFGYFKGSINGMKVESTINSDVYKPSSRFILYPFCKSGDGLLSFGFNPKGYGKETIGIGFYFNSIKMSKGKHKNLFFNETGDLDCDELLSINHSIGSDAPTYGIYNFISNDSYIKISEVTDDKVEGCFEARFKSRLKIDSPSNDLLMPTSLVIICEKFIAPRF